jgi:translation initiation factor 5A
LQLIDVGDDGFVSLLNEDGSTKDDLTIPAGDLGEEIKAAFAEYVGLSFPQQTVF